MLPVVALLDETHTEMVKRIWRSLAAKFDLRVGHHIAIPHFTFAPVAGFEVSALHEALDQFARETPPFIANTSGLGMFTGDKHALYVPIVRNPSVNGTHQRLLARLAENVETVSPHYQAADWLPHVTLVFPDADASKIPDVVRWCMSYDFDWDILVERLAVLDPDDKDDGVLFEVRLRGTP